MKILAISLMLSLGVSGQAQQQRPSYGGVRELAEQQDPTNNVPTQERVYVCSEWPVHQASFIQRFQDGLTIRQLINKTKLKDKEVEVIIFRRLTNSPPTLGIYTNYEGENVFNATVNPTNNPTFKIRAEDAILFTDTHELQAYQ
ncbi:MAG TPA: hypothetical protein VMD27_06550 [Candidatus Aquilonibacter sp.]|nr:hypothetical protein [Candidatus Aquilonibacter sp.]